jgi:hypothetical protein
MSGGGGSGSQQTTTQSNQKLPQWEREPAKAYLSSLMGYVFPGSTVPSSWFNTPGESFPTGGANTGVTTTGGGAGGGGGQAAASMLQQIDPSGSAYSLFSPMISGSPFLQNMAAQNPAAFAGATSPAAASQLAGLYGGSNPLGGFTSGLTTNPNPANPVMGGGMNAGTPSPSSFGGMFSPGAAGTAAAPPPPAPAPPPAPVQGGPTTQQTPKELRQELRQARQEQRQEKVAARKEARQEKVAARQQARQDRIAARQN